MINLKDIYASMSDADLAREIRLNYGNFEYLKELWAEEDRRIEEANLMIESNQY